MRLPTDRPPVHPGEILSEEFIKPFGMTVSETASRIGKKPDIILQIIKGEKNIDADMALRLSKLFSTSPELWLNGQMNWDMWHILYGNNAAEIEVIEPIMI
ncbi:Toxin-antitoxin system, antitoxin component [Desulfonema limicola]|uniref:Toxin-antitoxin system, antitoxin component n=1 Tax=Desulfonema limicola TaxID=45656 RepID=A0A975BDS2_9BACT|nr:HigA family addiction module antitoxin [Desulfonema limicola]QTA83468.1 Toxin-antitoxin system, antitoxin component [Desulfonema limicola]